MSANNHGRLSAGRGSNRQRAMNREAMHQQRFHAVQLSQLAHQQRVAKAAQYGAAYPTTMMPDLETYSIMQRSRSLNVGLPPTRTPYNPSTVSQLPSSALLNALSSLNRPIPSSTPPQATSLHQAAMHPIQRRNASMVPLGVERQVHSPLLMDAEPQPASASWWEMKEEHRRKTFLYRDFAKDYESNKRLSHPRSNYNQTFPVTLYEILSNSELKDYISWLPHGRAFKIHNPEEVEEQVLPRYFRGTKISSFMRQVNGWGFRRIPTGPDQSSYYHEMFLRGFPHLCNKMHRPTTQHKLKSSSDPKAHPNFYDTKTLVALPDEEPIRTCKSPSKLSLGNTYQDMDGNGSGSDQGTRSVDEITLGDQAQAALYSEGGMFTMSNLYNSRGGSDQDSSLLGGKLYGSVVGTCSESGSNPDASGSSEQGFGSDNGGSREGERSTSASPTNEPSSDGSAAASFERFATSIVPQTNPSSGSESGEAGTTASDGSSTAQKSSETSKSNERDDTQSSNGNSSDGSRSFLHLLTETALREAARTGALTPGIVMTDGNNDGDYRLDSNSSGGSDTGSGQGKQSRRSSSGHQRKRARHQDARLVVAGKTNKSHKGCSNSGSPSNSGCSVEESDTSSFSKFGVSVSRMSQCSRSDSGDAGTTTSDGSSSAPKSPSQSNRKSCNQRTNGNSSDGSWSGSGSFLHLLTETALRGAALPEATAPGFNTGDGESARSSTSSTSSVTGSFIEMPVSRWDASPRGSPRKRAHRQITKDAQSSLEKHISPSNARHGESSDDSSSDGCRR